MENFNEIEGGRVERTKMTTSYHVEDDRCSDEEEDNPLPAINLPEKIVFVVDNTRERNCSPFRLSTLGGQIMPLFMIKRIVENFVSIKSSIQRSHEYALMVLNSKGSQWICDFTDNIKTIVNHLDVINEDILVEDEQVFDIGSTFEKIHSKLPQPANKENIIIPTFVSRVILIYSRSNIMPRCDTGKRVLDDLKENPYLFVDVLYVHEPPSSENLCQAIYTELTSLVTTSYSYVLEVGRNVAKLHDNMAMLLAHPLQRPPQSDASYTIYTATSLQGVHTNV